MRAARIALRDAQLPGIITVAVGLRVGAAFYLGNQLNEMPGIADQISYQTLALRVLEGHGFSFATDWWPSTPAGQPTAHWSYLYVLALAGIYGITGPVPLAARLIQALAVGLLQPWLTYRITNRMFGPRAGLMAASLASGYVYFVYYAGALVTESLFFVAILWSVDAAMRVAVPGDGRSRGAGFGSWLVLGAALGSTVLLRQSAGLLIPVVLGWIAVCRGRRGERRHPAAVRLGAGMAAALLVIASLILPWTVRNYAAFGQIVPLNTNAGFAFFWGNHPVHGTHFIPILPSSTYGKLIPDDLRGLNEAQLDKALLRRGLGFAVEDPLRYLQLSFSRASEYLRVWPSTESGTAASFARLLSFGLCAPLFVAGILLAVRSKQADLRDAVNASHPGIWLLLAIASTHSLVHLLTWTLVRYRLPMDALLLPFAGLALVWAWDRVNSRRDTSSAATGGRSDALCAAPPTVTSP